MNKEISIWRNGNFIKFFSANTLANLGNWFDFVGVLILFRYTWKADPMLIALIPIMYAIPSILLGQFAGVFADRRNKRKILIYSNWFRAVLTLLLVFTPTPWLALPILFLRNTAGVISLPAQQGLMRNIVEEKNIMQAITINGSLFQLVKVIGPLMGGSVAGISSPNVSIAINAIAFTISGILLRRIKVQEIETSVEIEATQSGFLGSWKEGWQIVLNSKILMASIIFGIFSVLTIQMIDAQIVTLFSEVFPNKPEFTGWAISAIGIGSLFVVILLNKHKKITKFGWFFGTGSLLIGVMTVGFGFLSDFNLIVLAIFLSIIGGIGNGLTFTAVNYIIQTEPPKEAIGRVTGIIDSLMSILFIAGPLLGGLLITQLRVLTAFKTIGLALSIIGIAGIFLQNLLWKQNKPAKVQIEVKVKKGNESF
ncbi:MFS transporter [Rummeliibacillus stabekisii]|uniref:MFS transporter n=1 Tax=Rummeliibacillus stabekisii TaxID=241244 RepID=UPI00203E933C|nr:MFS transporter [Rummeliibacillus stabekisii]MCM3318079.1 MFS transporter [Rummeliibacillus stabekisii]